MHNTKIEWCDSTWNPVTGCRHGCEYCYAHKIAERFSTANKAHTFTGGHPIGEIHELDEPAIVPCSAFAAGKIAPYPFGFEPTFHRYRLTEPRHWKKPRTIFVCSMADLFGTWVPDGWIDAVFSACAAAPWHRYMFLTKNPQRYVDLATANKLPQRPNMWYGSTAPTPETEWFITGGAWNTFLSVEPILKPFEEIYYGKLRTTGLVIIGAETGNRKNKVVPNKSWIDTIVDACKPWGVSVFMKESLSPIIGEENMLRELPWNRNGGQPDEST